VKKRENLAKAIYDLGKLVFAALALGPIVSPEVFSLAVAVGGGKHDDCRARLKESRLFQHEAVL
jgi:hypothetical protein